MHSHDITQAILTYSAVALGVLTAYGILALAGAFRPKPRRRPATRGRSGALRTIRRAENGCDDPGHLQACGLRYASPWWCNTVDQAIASGAGRHSAPPSASSPADGGADVVQLYPAQGDSVTAQ